MLEEPIPIREVPLSPRRFWEPQHLWDARRAAQAEAQAALEAAPLQTEDSVTGDAAQAEAEESVILDWNFEIPKPPPVSPTRTPELTKHPLESDDSAGPFARD